MNRGGTVDLDRCLSGALGYGFGYGMYPGNDVGIRLPSL